MIEYRKFPDRDGEIISHMNIARLVEDAMMRHKKLPVRFVMRLPMYMEMESILPANSRFYQLVSDGSPYPRNVMFPFAGIPATIEQDVEWGMIGLDFGDSP